MIVSAFWFCFCPPSARSLFFQSASFERMEYSGLLRKQLHFSGPVFSYFLAPNLEEGESSIGDQLTMKLEAFDVTPLDTWGPLLYVTARLEAGNGFSRRLP